MKLKPTFSTLFSFALLFAILWTPVAFAQMQNQSVVKNINPGAADAEPEGLTAWNGKVYFVATDGVHGFEPWVSDGTESGTYMLKDINPGSGNGCNVSTVHLDNDFTNFFRPGAGGKLYFVASASPGDNEVWITDGTETGTTVLKDLTPGTSGSSPSYFKNLNNYTFFTAWVNNASAMYRTDGTAAGTIALAPINLRFRDEIVMNNKLYFCADSTGIGAELWVTDGTPAGTRRVKDLYTGSGNGNPMYFAQLGNQILFNADSADTGRELWISDGTAQGTRMLKDINLGDNEQGNPTYLTVFQNKIFFSARDTAGEELWVSDGTRAGTQQFKNLNVIAGQGANVFGLVVFNNHLWFAASTPAFIQSLWKSDGNPAGTVSLNRYTYGVHLPVGDRMYFCSRTPPTVGNYIWFTDGNTLTQIPYYIGPGQGSYASPFYTYELKAVGNELFATSEFATQVGYELSKVVTVTSTASVLTDEPDLIVYPNPVQDWLFVKTNDRIGKEETAVVLDMMGREIIATNGTEKVDVRSLAPGMYSVKAGNAVKRFVKE